MQCSIRKLCIAFIFFTLAVKWCSAQTYSINQNFQIQVDNQEQAFSIHEKNSEVASELVTFHLPSFQQITRDNVRRFFMWWQWDVSLDRSRKVGSLGSNRQIQNGVEFDMLGVADEVLGILQLHGRKNNRLHIKITTSSQYINRIQLSLKGNDEDRYYGMGERYAASEITGRIIQIWAQEKVGDTTYAPIPYFLNPKGYGLLMEGSRYAEYDFRKSDPSKTTIIYDDNKIELVLFTGSEPLQILENSTAYTGRIPRVPPEWAFAPMANTIGGGEKAREVKNLLRNRDIPTSAFWVFDYWYDNRGESAFTVDDKYPHYKDLIEGLHKDGFKYLGYFSPWVYQSEADAFNEGDANEYFTKKPDGSTYTYAVGLDQTAELDVTNPDAVSWWENKFFDKYVDDYKVDGWMHDFGEHTPPDGHFFNGDTGWEMHNRYPELWSKVALDYWEKKRPDGDYFFYTRSANAYSQKYASVMWAGDPNGNWEKGQGLPSQIPAILSLGMSGHPIVTTDIAGYHCIFIGNTGKELFQRWVEFGAMLPVMRNHRGAVEQGCNHWSFDRDEETIIHYKKYAQLHTELFPYFYTLAKEAKETGHPVIRHLMLHYPRDPAIHSIEDQFLIGDRLLVAPVVTEGAVKRDVYFPEGKWRHYWSGKVYTGPGRHDVSAPIGEVPLFQKEGTILPMFTGTIHTLVRESTDSLQGWDDVNSKMVLRFAGEGRDELEIWDGTRIGLEKKGDSCKTSISDPGLNRKYEFPDCVETTHIASTAGAGIPWPEFSITAGNMLLNNPSKKEFRLVIHNIKGAIVGEFVIQKGRSQITLKDNRISENQTFVGKIISPSGGTKSFKFVTTPKGESK